jgi:SNF2 family DNA or RNA helicase
MTIDARIARDGIHLNFPFNKEIISAIKRIPGCWWNPIKKDWRVPFYSIDNLVATPEFADVAYNVKQWVFKRNARIDELTSNLHKEHPELFGYQIGGAKFILDRQTVFLYMDMGTGKTITSLAPAKILLDIKAISRVFIFAPLSVKQHWKNEAKKYYDLPALIIGGGISERSKAWKEVQQYPVVIMHYELATIPSEQEILRAIIGNGERTMIILDECTRIKNYKTKASMFLRDLPGMYKVLLSGRPIENRPDELYSMNRFLKNSLLGSWEQFYREFMVTDAFGRVVGYRNLDLLGLRLNPIIYKVGRKAIAHMLPSKTEVNHMISLSPVERTDYNQIVETVYELLDEVKDNKVTFDSVKTHFFSRIQLMKMMCDHPSLVKQSESKLVGQLNMKSQYSSKLHELKSVLDSLCNENVIIFTQFAKMAQIIHTTFSVDRKVFMVTGDTRKDLRDEIIRQFEENAFSILVCTDVFSYGTNLQYASNYVINYDMPWNPAVFDQRIARVFRIGQKHPVHIINLIVDDEDKVERKILDVLNKKREIYTQVFGEELV